MEKQTPEIWDYDIEVYPNLFSATFWNEEKQEKKVFSIFNKTNDLFEMVKWILSFKGNVIFVGYNSHKYDDIIMVNLISRLEYFLSINQLAINQKLYQLSLLLIKKEPRERTKIEKEFIYGLMNLRPRYFKSWDLLEIIREGYSVKSLKGVAINLKFPKIQDLPYPFDTNLTVEEGEEVIEYNFNDVKVTTAIRLFIKERLKMRQILSDKFKVDLSSSSDSTIGRVIFDKYYAEKSGIHINDLKDLRTPRKELIIGDIILPWVQFKSPLYQDWFEKLKRVRVWNIEGKQLSEGYEENEFGELVKIKNTKAVQFNIPKLESEGMTYIIGLGGIHSKDAPGIFDNSENVLLDLDVASQYPRRLIHSKIAPAHLDRDTFSFVLESMVNERLHNKKLGKTDDIARIISEGLKISINAVYGFLIYAYYFLFDPVAGYTVTINNQLAILMLIEELNLNGINIISANTDGIILYDAEHKLEMVRTIYKGWESTTGFTLEETFYSKYIRRDINNYITIKTNGEVKNKGIFIPQNGILKGYDKPVVAIALQEYFLHGKKPEEVIKKLGYEYKFVNPDFPHGEQRQTDIYDYCMAKKVGDTYEGAYLAKDGDINQLTKLQKNLRYYASTTGDTIFKIKKVDGKPDSFSNMLVSSPITLLNDFVDKKDYHINYEYYLDEVKKIIAKIEGRKWIDREKSAAKIAKLQQTLSEREDKLQKMMDNGKSHLKAFAVLQNLINKNKEELNLYIKENE